MTTIAPKPAPAKAAAAPVPGTAAPSGVLLELQNGDRACYVCVATSAGHQCLEGDFALCAGGGRDATHLVGKRVTWTTEPGTVLAASCEGNPDCGKSDHVDVVVALEPADPPPAFPTARQRAGTVVLTDPKTQRTTAFLSGSESADGNGCSTTENVALLTSHGPLFSVESTVVTYCKGAASPHREQWVTTYDARTRKPKPIGELYSRAELVRALLPEAGAGPDIDLRQALLQHLAKVSDPVGVLRTYDCDKPIDTGYFFDHRKGNRIALRLTFARCGGPYGDYLQAGIYMPTPFPDFDVVKP